MAATDPTQDLAAWFVHDVTVERYRGRGPAGDLYDDPTAEACFVDDTQRLIRSATGEQVVSSTTLALAATVDPIPTGSKVTLDAPFPHRVAKVLAVSVGVAPGLPVPEHVELHLT